MNATLIGISSGLVTILLIALLKSLDKKIIYSLILTGIGFLYVGYAWSDHVSIIINSLQAIFFLLFSYYGYKKSFYFLATGYFLHGVWDFVYDLFSNSSLIPPHYDMFCLSIDFIMGFYLLIIQYQMNKKVVAFIPETF